MRVAVFYSGALRTLKECWQNQNDTFSAYDAQLYFYTYDKPHGVSYRQFIQIPKVFYPDFIDLYKENMNPISNGVHNTLNQWHNQLTSFCLVPSNYDIYVKSRCDVKIEGKIKFEEYKMNDTDIYIPVGNDHFGGVNDQFAFGSYEVMKKYCSVYLNHAKIFARGVCFHTELYVKENLQDLGVNIVRIQPSTHIVR